MFWASLTHHQGVHICIQHYLQQHAQESIHSSMYDIVTCVSSWCILTKRAWMNKDCMNGTIGQLKNIVHEQMFNVTVKGNDNRGMK